MEFKDWVPLLVALVGFSGVLLAPSLGGNRPRQQLEALKAVREGISATDDDEVEERLRVAEKDIARRIEARYRPWLSRIRIAAWLPRIPWGVALAVALGLGTAAVIQYFASAHAENSAPLGGSAQDAVVGVVIGVTLVGLAASVLSAISARRRWRREWGRDKVRGAQDPDDPYAPPGK
ncbi:hypothetical protein [Leifsonia aquatica]|uniref:hypothetical protein n=1 Tax=Leifsonia aquatica TaxID=144185 RepID=UPI00381D3458